MQAFASLHPVPLGLAGFEHTPVAGAHVPTSWQASIAVHTTGLPPAHAPDVQASTCVHPFPSLHAVPFGAPPQVTGVTVLTAAEVGDPGLNSSITTEAVPGAWFASKRKL